MDLKVAKTKLEVTKQRISESLLNVYLIGREFDFPRSFIDLLWKQTGKPDKNSIHKFL